MDTIIGLYRGVQENSGDVECAYEIKIFPIQDYRLIRVELREDFFAGQVPWGERSLRERLGAGRRERLRVRRQEQLAERLRGELAPLLDERDDNYCFAAGSLARGQKWRDIIPLPEFEGYLKWDWVRRMLPNAVYPHFVVLGTVPFLRELLCGLAPCMKSLLWVLPDRAYGEMPEDFAEDFYQEYGIAIDMRFPENDEFYGQMRIDGKWLKEPVNILDFVQDSHIPGIKLGSGGVWLDMAAVEEKERRIEARKWGVTYFSLKKQWTQLQKAGSCKKL